jgi:hypothetical protein
LSLHGLPLFVVVVGRSGVLRMDVQRGPLTSG